MGDQVRQQQVPIIGEEQGVYRLHPGITQEIAPNESQRGSKTTTRGALIYEALFVARWLRSRFEKGS